MSISTKLLTSTLILISTAFGATMDQATATNEVKAPTSVVQRGDTLARVQKHVDQKSVTVADFDDLSALMRESPRDFRLHKLLGDCYAAAGLTALSETEYLTSMAENPRRDDLFIAAITQKFKQYGLIAAEQELRVMQDKLPDSPVIVLLRVQLMLARDNEWGAEHVCDVWERTHANKFCLPTARALVHFQSKQYTRALVEVEKDLRQRPDFGPAVALKKKILSSMNAARKLSTTVHS